MKAEKGKFYFGGIHPHDKKSPTASIPIEKMPAPQEAYVSLSQSLGAPADAIVEVGAKVKEGQLIGKASAKTPISSNVFSSVSGTVKEISEFVGASGAPEKYIVITSAEDGEKAYLPPLDDKTQENLRKRIVDCGIVGLGGAGFPTAVKVAPSSPVDTLVINGAECEPYLTCDHRLMVEHTDEIARGARYLATAVGAKQIIIAIESNKPDCIKAFEPYEDIRVISLRKQYPMGGEKQLVYVTTGRKIAVGKLPADCGILVQNVATAFAVCEAVELGKPLYERVLTVSGECVANPKNLLVRVGTPVRAIVDFCGGETNAPKKVVQGGPMTGVALASYDIYTHKTTSGVLLLSKNEAATDAPTPCLGCGKCVDVCPMHIMPVDTAFYSSAGDFEAALKYGNALSCIECGSCEYVCPAKRPLIQAIRKTKAWARNNAKKENGNG